MKLANCDLCDTEVEVDGETVVVRDYFDDSSRTRVCCDGCAAEVVGATIASDRSRKRVIEEVAPHMEIGEGLLEVAVKCFQETDAWAKVSHGKLGGDDYTIIVRRNRPK